MSIARARTRAGGALAAIAIEAGIAVLVVWGLAVRHSPPPRPGPSLVTVTVQPEPPPLPVPDDIGAGSPRKAAPPARSPVADVPLASASPRMAPAPGLGEGAGEQGGAAGTGSGTGRGVGAGQSVAAPPSRIAGALGDRDYPRGARGAGGTVGIAFRVRADGGVDDCRVIAPSGSEMLDALTCRLVEQRFRYRPARDAGGQAVDAVQRTSFTWSTRRRD